MKRTTMLCALLLFCGTVCFALPSSAETTSTVSTVNASPTDPSPTEKSILRQAGQEVGYTYAQMLDLYQHGQVSITEVAGGGYEVAIMQADGNPIIIGIEHGI